MSDVTRILDAIDTGDVAASERLLPLVYDELRRLAARNLARETPGQTLNPTALVHEAYVRLVDQQPAPSWNSRGHFFCAAAEAMRRILIENSRRKQAVKHGGQMARAEKDLALLAEGTCDDREHLVALTEALDRLSQSDRAAAELVRFRYFAGLTSQQAAELLGVSARTADRMWVYARSWLYNALRAV